MTAITVRLPDKIYTWLKEKAKKKRRSMNKQVLFYLEQICKSEENNG